MPEQPRSQRTEKPTARRLKKARKRGQVARSKEIPGALVLLGFLAFAHFFGPAWLEKLQQLMCSFIYRPALDEFTDTNLALLFRSTTISTSMLLALPVGIVAVSSLGGNLLQAAPVFTFKPLTPKLSKLNPINGLKKIVSLKQQVEVLKGLLKMSLFGAASYTAARDVILEGTPGAPGAHGTMQMLASLAGAIILRCALLASGLAIFDLLFRKYDHVRDLKMTKREIKDEYKETEGDPMVRARIRQKQTALARSRMMAEVPNATVVITNPDHVAIALRYVQGESVAPKLLAKGRALLAARIKEIAKAHKVPIISDPPLARALYSAVPLGAEIPPAFFRAVAEVLALVISPGERKRTAQRVGKEIHP